jgi:hypothetical protein
MDHLAIRKCKMIIMEIIIDGCSTVLPTCRPQNPNSEMTVDDTQIASNTSSGVNKFLNIPQSSLLSYFTFKSLL